MIVGFRRPPDVLGQFVVRLELEPRPHFGLYDRRERFVSRDSSQIPDRFDEPLRVFVIVEPVGIDQCIVCRVGRFQPHGSA